jgi:hypothetical protein
MTSPQAPHHTEDVPAGLRTWFVVHFVADVLFALPLIVAPTWLGSMLGYPAIDPLMGRLVGAALVGIGVESLLGRNATRASFLTMLRLKVLWSGTANIGIALTLLQGAPPIVWMIQGIFAFFFALWTRYLLLLRRS